MYSRVVLFELDTVRLDVADAAEVFRTEVLERLQAQEGYEGVVLLTTPEGKGMILSFWHTEDEAAAAKRFGSALLDEYLAFFTAPPGRDHYTVAVADLPGITVG